MRISGTHPFFPSKRYYEQKDKTCTHFKFGYKTARGMSQLCHASWMPDILWSSRLLALSAVRRPPDSTLQWLKEVHVTVRIWIELGKLSFDNQSVHQSSQAWVLVTRQVDNLSNWRVFIPSYWLSGFLDISEIFWSTLSRRFGEGALVTDDILAAEDHS